MMTALPSEQRADEQQALREMASVVSAALAKGKNRQEIVKDLVRAGWPEESAKGLVGRLLP